MVQIGSSAIRFWFPDFPREVKDYDFAVGEERSNEIIDGIKHEYIFCPPIANLRGIFIANIDVLYTLKVSHLFWDINWEKHIFDVQFLKNKGCKLVDWLFKELYEFWQQRHKQNKRVDFNKKNEEFFDDLVTREYPHDFLHEAIAYPENPIFERFKKDLDLADIDEDIFKEKLVASPEECIELVRQESQVIALERFILTGKVKSPLTAYRRALKMLITRLSPLWLAIYIIENYEQLKNTNDYYLKFKNYDRSRNNQ